MTTDQKLEKTQRPRSSVRSWSTGRKVLVSLFVIWHIGAVVSAPCAYPPPSSQLARNVTWLFSNYQLFAFLNQGYRFFAPDPGPSHIVRYEVDTVDGETIKGEFPDRDRIWPRLMYHRHFMISETVYREGGPISNGAPQIETDVLPTPEQQEALDAANREYEVRRAMVEALHKGIARELIDRYDGETRSSVFGGTSDCEPRRCRRRFEAGRSAAVRTVGSIGRVLERRTLKIVRDYFRELFEATTGGWDRFWFSARSPETFCLIRILAGAMLFYTHLVWSTDFAGFFGDRGRLSLDFVHRLHQSSGDVHGFAWSHFFWIESASVLWSIHLLGLIVFLLFMVGFASRITSVLAFLITVSYVHRAQWGAVRARSDKRLLGDVPDARAVR